MWIYRYIFIYIYICFFLHFPIINTYKFSILRINTDVYTRTYIQTHLYIHTYAHTYIHTDVLTCTHKFIHTHILTCLSTKKKCIFTKEHMLIDKPMGACLFHSVCRCHVCQAGDYVRLSVNYSSVLD